MITLIDQLGRTHIKIKIQNKTKYAFKDKDRKDWLKVRWSKWFRVKIWIARNFLLKKNDKHKKKIEDFFL